MLSADDRFCVIPDQTPQTAALLVGVKGDALDVPRGECFTASLGTAPGLVDI